MTATAAATRPTSFLAADARADGAQRRVSFAPGLVRIDRRLQGMSMRIGVPMAQFSGVLLRLLEGRNGAACFQVSLAHADPDLAIVLEETADAGRGDASWRRWGEDLRLPLLVERVEGRIEPLRTPPSSSTPDRRCKPGRSRRGRFAARRRMGEAGRAEVRFAGEREIIARD